MVKLLMDSMEDSINFLIANEQYKSKQSDKERSLLPILKQQMANSYKKNTHYKSMIDKLGLNIELISSIKEIPPIPSSAFKNFDLSTSNEIFIELQSSGTTGSSKSSIPVNKISSVRQRKALVSTFKSKLGAKRKPLLVFDYQGIASPSETLTARGAAIRGLSLFAKEICYVFKDIECKEIDFESIKSFINKYNDSELIIFGFTYVLWTRLFEQKEFLKLNDLKKPFVIHGGGWKKLESLSVSKSEFDKRLSSFFNTDKSKIIDYYGMVEQIGVIFLDCDNGNKLIPDFADVIVRDFYSLEPCSPGKKGYINILSILPDSYPGMSIITEDVGEIINNCSCGSQSNCFRFISRVEKSELRGCGDTFVE